VLPEDRNPGRTLFLKGREWFFALLLPAALTAWLRLSIYGSVMVEGRPLPPQPDAFYQLRRISLTVPVFPLVPVTEEMLNWPRGAPCHWSPGFTWAAAAFVKVLGGGSYPEGTAVFFPVLPGVLAVLAAVGVTRMLVPPERGGDLVALGAGFIAAVMPWNIRTSQFANVDHHIFEVLTMLLLGGWVLAAARWKKPRTINISRYPSRAPFSVDKIQYSCREGSVIYKTKMVKGPNRNFQVCDPLDFLAAVTSHIPDRREHSVRYYGWYSSVQRGRRRKQGFEDSPLKHRRWKTTPFAPVPLVGLGRG
jgi:asparagine N-glycosylation enzyme membrane subunit Stt3